MDNLINLKNRLETDELEQFKLLDLVHKVVETIDKTVALQMQLLKEIEQATKETK